MDRPIDMTIAAPLPPIVDKATWAKEVDALLLREKAATKELDAIAAARRRLPMTLMPDYTFQSADGPIKFADVFQGHSQLIVYQHMWDDGAEWKCHGCTLMVSHWNPGAFEGLRNYDARLVVSANGTMENILEYQKKTGSEVTFYSTRGTDFEEQCKSNGRGMGLNVPMIVTARKMVRLRPIAATPLAVMV